jgi:predicted Zn-dependent peptidase
VTRESHFVEHTLANGLRIVIEPMPHVASAAAGFLVQTGARDETPDLAGVSHFVEHMCFKGTPKRTWQQITGDFDDMGSTYNAYTSRERTFYFGWVRVEDFEKQVELLADMMRSIMPPEEFETEKKVILEEIAMSDDQIDSRIYELLHQKIYDGHSLRWPVLGTTETISALPRQRLYDYFQDRYQPANMILLVAGAVDPKVVIATAQRICGDWPSRAPRPPRAEAPRVKDGRASINSDRFGQQGVALAYAAPGSVGADRETADVFAAILGGSNSRFFWQIVQTGVAPQVAAGRLDYCDAGIMLAYGFCEPQRAEDLLAAMRREIAKVQSDGVTEEEVQRVKNRTRTTLATESEAPYYRLMQLAGDVDVLGHPRTVAERLAAIEAVTPRTISGYLQRWPLSGEGFLATLGPRDWLKLTA